MQLISIQSAVILTFLAVACLYLWAIMQGVNKTATKATPSVSTKHAILVSHVSMVIHGTVDEVFEAITNYRDYSWSSGMKYEWEKLSSDGTPEIESSGRISVEIQDFISRTFKIKLTSLDRDTKMIAERSIDYMPFLFQTEKFHQVLPVEGHKGLCEYNIWLSYRGVAALFLLFTADEEIVATQRKFAEDLKTFVENRKGKKTALHPSNP